DRRDGDVTAQTIDDLADRLDYGRGGPVGQRGLRGLDDVRSQVRAHREHVVGRDLETDEVTAAGHDVEGARWPARAPGAAVVALDEKAGCDERCAEPSQRSLRELEPARDLTA